MFSLLQAWQTLREILEQGTPCILLNTKLNFRHNLYFEWNKKTCVSWDTALLTWWPLPRAWFYWIYLCIYIYFQEYWFKRFYFLNLANKKEILNGTPNKIIGVTKSCHNMFPFIPERKFCSGNKSMKSEVIFALVSDIGGLILNKFFLEATKSI